MYHNINILNVKASSVDLTALILRHRRNLRSLLGRCKVETERVERGDRGRERRGGGRETRVPPNVSTGLYKVSLLSPHRARQLYRMDIAGTSVAAAMLGTAIKETHCTYKVLLDMCDMKTATSTHETTSYLLNLHSPAEDVNKSQHNKQ